MENTVPNRQNKFAKVTETFESSLQQKSADKFQVDKILYKGIKENDVAKIIDVSKDGGIFQDEQKSELKELETIFVQMRKKYDQVKIQSRKSEAQSEKHRQTIEVLKAEQIKLRNIIDTSKTDCLEKQEAQRKMNQTIQICLYNRDICAQILDNLKHDILILKKRNFDKQILYHKEGSKLRSLKTQEFTKTRLSYRCKGMLESIQKTVSNRNQERKTKMNSFHDILTRKYDKISKQEQRQKDIQQVMMRAMSQKLQQQKQWINMCNANVFFKKFLKSKMEKIINKNHVVESAFHKIKMATDIADSKQFIDRYLNRQINYGSLLDSISAKQKILEDLKSQQHKLQIKYQEMHHTAQQLLEQHVETKFQSQKIFKELNHFDNQCKEMEAKKNLMFEWALKFLCVFNNKKKEQLRKQFSQEHLSGILTKSLTEIRNYLQNDNLNEKAQKINEQRFTVATTHFTEEAMHRNNRIKTLTAFEEGKQFEEKQQEYDDVSERDYLQYNRRITKKNEYSRRFRIKTKPN